MTPDKDLPILEQQEQVLRFSGFDAESAWKLGSMLRSALLARTAGGSIEIEVAGQLLFACATPGANPGQANWIRRKRNTVHFFGRSSYAVGRRLERDGGTVTSRHGLPEMDYAAHGGGFPIWVIGTGAVGSVVLSGLPQRDDHNLVVESMAALLAVDLPRLS